MESTNVFHYSFLKIFFSCITARVRLTSLIQVPPTMDFSLALLQGFVSSAEFYLG